MAIIDDDIDIEVDNDGACEGDDNDDDKDDNDGMLISWMLIDFFCVPLLMIICL